MKTPMNEPITMFKKQFNFLSMAVHPFPNYDFSVSKIGSYGFNFFQIISFRIIHTTTTTTTMAPSNSNSVYHGADCMTYKFGKVPELINSVPNKNSYE